MVREKRRAVTWIAAQLVENPFGLFAIEPRVFVGGVKSKQLPVVIPEREHAAPALVCEP